MTAVWTALQRAYHLVNYEWADPRTQHWPLVQRPFSIVALMAGYVFFVTRLGPWIMRDRKPMQLQRVLVVYNFLQIVINVFLCYMVSSRYWFSHYSWQCEPIDRSSTPHALEMTWFVNMYFWIKISDLLDTVFFVLRKKDRQISFLHVYHHSMMILLSWHGVKYFPGGHVTFLGLVNSFVHAVMYTYYLISAIYPQAIWWKKHVTQLQLVQHMSVFIHQGQLLVHNPCGHPLYAPLMLTPQALLVTVLFLRFYKRAYGPKASPRLKAH